MKLIYNPHCPCTEEIIEDNIVRMTSVVVTIRNIISMLNFSNTPIEHSIETSYGGILLG